MSMKAVNRIIEASKRREKWGGGIIRFITVNGHNPTTKVYYKIEINVELE